MTNPILTHDAATSAFDGAGGVVSTDDDGVSFDWDENHIVRVDAPSDLEGAFDTDRFYKIEGATIARPIKQTYLVGDELQTYKKPADALRRAAWSFDNAPFTLGHPESGMVKNVDDIHGFWRGARYNEDEEGLKEDLYIPANDDEALEWIEEHKDVSVGFYNRVAEDFDGDTGDLTDDDVDGFQVQLYGDHIAGVKRGRCSGEDGCGLDADDSPHGNVVATDVDTDTNTAADCGCNTEINDNMTDNNDDDFDIPDLSVDALADKNDSVSDLKAERDSLEESLDEMKSDLEAALDTPDNLTIEVDEDECICEGVSALAEAADEAAEKAAKVEDLQDELREYREDEREEALDTLSDLGADVDEYEDADLDTIEEEVERRKEVLDAAPDVTVKDIGSSTDSKSDETKASHSGPRKFGRGHNA